MDPIKKAFVDEVRTTLRRRMEADGFPMLEEQYTEHIDVEMREVSSLVTEFRINQGPYKGPRYFDVIIKERF